MGKIIGNAVTTGFSGKLGKDLIFRQMNGKTFFAQKVVSNKKPSAKQVKLRESFAEASHHAGAAILDPATREEYTEMAQLMGYKSAYIAAFTDFITPPQIAHVSTTNYYGKVGDLIVISVKIPFKIVRMSVTILAANGSVIETGNAEPMLYKFRYRVTVANASLQGTKVIVRAYDRRRREVVAEVVITE